LNPTPPPPNLPTATTEAPFAGLMPDVVLDALAAVGFEGDGRLTQLNSFENRVLQVMLSDGRAVVAKFYRPSRWSDQQIAEEHAFSLEAAADEVPVVAPLELQPAHADGPVRACEAAPRTLACYSGAAGTWRFAVWPRRAGRTPELEDPDVLLRLGSCLGRLHRIGERRAFGHRRSMAVLADARDAVARLQRSAALPPDQKLPWSQACEQALTYIEGATRQTAPAAIRLHGDCHPGNLLWRDDRPILVDLDDACNGPAVQDLWMLLSGEAEAAREQLHRLIEGYERIRPFDRRELQLIDALRLGRMLHHNAWVSQRWADPAFPIAYPDFGSSSYWAQQSMQLREQLALARAA
jgi:Ser/Thr protein kinase RdoA (MazF antagonist)